MHYKLHGVRCKGTTMMYMFYHGGLSNRTITTYRILQIVTFNCRFAYRTEKFVRGKDR